MNKNSGPQPTIISQHLKEMLKSSANSALVQRKNSPEKIQHPPKPISPPRIYIEPEPGKIISQVIKEEKEPSIYSLFHTKVFKIISLDSCLKLINNFVDGGSRVNWLSSIRVICKQVSIPLIKEIIYNRNKTLESRKLFKKKLKEYLVKKYKENRSSSPIRPPFLASAKISLNSSKHVSCLQAKEETLKQDSSNLEEMRCKVLVEMNKANFELMRTVILIFQLLQLLADTRNDYINNGQYQRSVGYMGKTFKFWKEYSNKRAEKKEFHKLLVNSMEMWKKSRIMLGFKDMQTYRRRKFIKMCHHKTILQFKIKKRLINSWRIASLKSKSKDLEINITNYYAMSRLKLLILSVFNKKQNFKSLQISKNLIFTNTKKKLKELYLKYRIIDKIKKDYMLFYKDSLLVNKYTSEAIKMLEDYRGLLELNRKSLCLNASVPVTIAQKKELSIRYNKTTIIKKNISPNINMFTLSVSNLKSPENNHQEFLPDGLLLGDYKYFDTKIITECINKANAYYHKLMKIPLSFHIRKAVTLTKDFKGTSEKIAESQDSLRTISLFYQKWKRKFCKKWLENLSIRLYSLKACKNLFSRYISTRNTRKKTFKLLSSRHELYYKKLVFKGFQKILKFKRLQEKSKGILAQKYFHQWIKFIFHKATKLEKAYKASIHSQKKLIIKAFTGLKRAYNFSVASLVFRLISLKKKTLHMWKEKLDKKIMLKRVFSVSLNLWKERISNEFRSDSHMLAEIIKAWRFICESKGNTKNFRIKNLMATNFNKSKAKITSFFKWKRFYYKRKSGKKIEKSLSEFLVIKVSEIWKIIKGQPRLSAIYTRNKKKKLKIFNGWKELAKKNQEITTTNKIKISSALKYTIAEKKRLADKYYRILLMKKAMFALIVRNYLASNKEIL